MNVEYHRFCPNCGADMRRDQPMIVGSFMMLGDGHPLIYRGQSIRLTRTETAIVWSVLKAYPNTVCRETLLSRSGSDASTNMVQVLVRRIRIKLERAGIPDPLETVWGSGYRWREL